MESVVIYQEMSTLCLVELITMGSQKPGGRLKLFRKNWGKITKGPQILSYVSGVELEFTKKPFRKLPPNSPKFGLKEQENIEVELEKLLKKGAIKQVQPMENQFVGNLFLREKKSGGFRRVFNLKPLNQFIV